MLNRVLKLIMLIIISFSIIFSPVANSAEFMKNGSVLIEDSMVFSIDEADALRIRIEALENIEKKADSLKVLVEIQEQEILTLEDLLEIKGSQIDEWRSLSVLHQNRVEKMERREKFSKLENVGWFILGVGVTGGAIYLGDKIGDSMEHN